MTEKEKVKKRYSDRMKKGLCSRCGKVPPIQGIKLCELCNNYQKQWAAKKWQSPEGKKKLQKNLVDYRNNNRELINKRAREYLKRVRLAVFLHYGTKCVCCGEEHLEFLTIDHINNDGKQHRAELGPGNFYVQIKTKGYPGGLQTMCWNCNEAKKIYGRCPHEDFSGSL